MTPRELLKLAKKSFRNTERNNSETNWDIISEYILPNQSGTFNHQTEAKGQKKTNRLYDSTAVQANHDLASAIHSTLTNPATTWSKIRFTDPELNENDEAVTWLEKVNQKIHDEFNNANFDNEVSRAYKQYTALGNMVVLHEEEIDENGNFQGFKFTAVHIANITWMENEKNVVDKVYRKIELTLEKIVKLFPDTVSEEIKEKAERSPDECMDIYHCVYKRKPEEIKIDSAGVSAPEERTYASVYLMEKGQNNETTILEEGGYYEFPFYVVRWETSPGEVYGRGPGSIAIPDVRTLNTSKELYLKAMARVANPPWLAQEKDMVSNFDFRPGKVTVVRDINGFKEIISNARFDVAQLDMQALKEAIQKSFYIDKLMLPPRTEHGEMTAFEVQQRVEQMQKVLGPTLGRLNHELLQPLIVRSFKIMLRNNQLGDIPETVREQGLDVDIEFVNQLARSQKAEDVSAIQAWMQMLGGMAQLGRPDVLDNANVDAAAKIAGRILGVPEQVIADEETINETRKQRQEFQQQQIELENQLKAADASSKTEGQQ